MLQNHFTDFEGNEIPIHFTQRTPSIVQKRASTLVTCELFTNDIQYIFDLSICKRPSAQAWACDSSDPTDENVTHRVDGSCASSQICVDGITNTVQGHDGPVAYCADIDQAYLDITPELIARLGDNPIRWYYGGLTGKSHAIEAVFGGFDPAAPITMESLNITAESSSGYSVGEPLSFNSCTNCSSLGIQPIPKDMVTAAIRFTAEPGAPGARMYIWTI